MRILIVQTAFLGDVVLTTPLFREVRRLRPEAELCVLTTETGRQALAAQSEVDRLLVLDKRWNGSGIRSYGGVLRTLGRERFDVAIAPHRSVRTGVLLMLSGAGLRIGFAGAPGAWAYHRRVPWNGARHAASRYLDLAGPLGGRGPDTECRPRLEVSSAARARAEALLLEGGVGAGTPHVCIAPGSVWATKRWLAEGFAEVVAAVRAWGFVPVIVGSSAERELGERIAERSGAAPVLLAGSTGVQELIALLAGARALVGNDSGPAHVAAAVGTPVVSVFGSTTPEQGYAALGGQTRVVEVGGLGCRPCGRHGHASCPLGHFQCMRRIPAGEVIDRLRELAGTADGTAPVQPRLRTVPG